MRHRRPLLHRPTPRRSAEAGLLPMINVVFLLLIFFLIAARLTPPEAFPVTLPDAAQTGLAEDGRFTLLLGAEGEVGYGATTGQAQALADLLSDRAAWCSATDCTSAPPALLIRADSMAPATALPGLMRAIEGMGFAAISLAVVPK
ncbi:MAG: biopolymer transporter ExbD [Rhodobacteraceae bacterium]|nr:biopolymer transporter ExbD [Paracoccaceae bacterium]MCF8515295.1 biopolymer transporter ExbD [Paracoccaceae bacterium]MCF8519521.1 biopolymer transporter ExbD [Paracoccaceae bacterium]